jgi:short-subunit dehydrogenase
MKKIPVMIAAAGGAGLLAWSMLRRRPADLHGKVVLITGGSRGLGLQMAREFGALGAAIAICARDQSELERARQDLIDRDIRVHSVACDVADRNSVEVMVREVGEVLGPVDVLVNNAGIIQVGPIQQQNIENFRQTMDVIFWGALYTTMAVLPSMRERRSGKIVNITSIGAKVSVPHLIPYGCAKFALLALSEGLRAELKQDGIQVISIVPGLMRTGSHLHAGFKGDHTKEYAWFSVGAATPLVAISAQRAARKIVGATLRGDSEKIISLPAQLLARFHGLLPELTGPIMALVNQLILPGSPESSTDLRTGVEARAQLHSRVLDIINWPGQKAAESLNQMS